MAIVGGKKRPTTVVDEIRRELNKYEDAHKMASESNATLHNAMKLHMDNLKLLALPLDQLKKEIPSLMDMDEESEASIAEVSKFGRKPAHPNQTNKTRFQG